MVAQQRTASPASRSLEACRPVLAALAIVVTTRGCLINPDRDYPVGGGSAGEVATDGGATDIAGSGTASTATDGGATEAASGGTASTGGAPGMCAFDVSRLTAALPSLLIWKDFTVASGNICAGCSYEPCGQLRVTWGAPVVQQDGTITYHPVYVSAASVPMLVHVGKNDGICSSQLQCEVKPTSPSVTLSVARQGAAWAVADAAASVIFAEDECTTGLGDPGELTAPMASDLEQEIAQPIRDLEFPCK